MARRAGVEEQKRIFFVNGIGFTHLAEDLAGISELRVELLPHLLPHLVAAGVDSRPDGGAQVPGSGAELTAHFAYAFFYNAVQGAAPASVKGAHGAPFC